MNEQQWNTCTDPQGMLFYLLVGEMLSDRKARLFAVACCRRIWHLLSDQRSREAVEFAERYADGSAPLLRLHEARREAINVPTMFRKRQRRAAASAAGYSAWVPITDDDTGSGGRASAEITAYYAAQSTGNSWEREKSIQAALLRDIVANPFAAPPHLDPAWLARNERTIPKLAEAAYEFRSMPSGELDSDRLAVLADALQEVGADDALIEHLHGPRTHVRGCFALDLLLEKE